MEPIYKIVRLSRGHVGLRAWPATNAPHHLLDLFTVTATLAHLREEWHTYDRKDVLPEAWGAFWRLVNASAGNATLPTPLTMGDRLLLLEAMWELNDVEDLDPKLNALAQRAARMMDRLSQGLQTSPSTSS